MDSDRPKLSEVADESDDTTQIEDEKRRHIQACFLSAEKEDDEFLLPGFRFHPADEKLLGFYLRRKVEMIPISTQLMKLVVEVDIYKYDPWDLPRSTTSFRTRPVELSQLNCPRCDSPNTKFCYYNNYSLSQPRHFCKNCRRYWTEGGTIRSIPDSSAVPKRSASAASTGKNEIENSNNNAKTWETLPLNIGNPDPTTVGYDYKEWYHYQTGGKKYKTVRPNRVTGSGFWKPTGTNKPSYYSNMTWPNYTSIFASLDNQAQPSKPQSNQHPARPEVRIDILDGNTDLLIHQSWKEYKDQLKNSLYDDDAMKIMSGTFTAVAGQVIGGVMVPRITSSAAASYTWAGSAVEIATVLGLCVTLAGISLRGRSRAYSALMIKIGAIITASAIVFSMGLHLPLAMALTVGPVIFLIMAAAAAFA